jgi:hypothetical protein
VPVDGFCESQATKDSKQPMPLLAYDAKSECHVRTNYSCIRPPFVTSLSTDWTFLTAGFRISRGAITALRVKNCLSSARTTRKDPKDRPKPVNATADTVRSRPIFREAYRKRRCPLTASVAIDGSKFKAVNTRDKNFTRGKVGRRRAQLEESAARYLAQLGTADRQEPSEELAAKTAHLRDKLVKLESEMQRLAAMEKLMLAPPEGA